MPGRPSCTCQSAGPGNTTGCGSGKPCTPHPPERPQATLIGGRAANHYAPDNTPSKAGKQAGRVTMHNGHDQHHKIKTPSQNLLPVDQGLVMAPPVAVVSGA